MGKASILMSWFRANGRKGGKARAASLSPAKRTAIARRAAKARWRKAKEAR